VQPVSPAANSGAGGSGASRFHSDCGNEKGSSGGSGYCTVIFGEAMYTRIQKVRRMNFIPAPQPATEGVVSTPRSYAVGQAGLWFGVEMETMPFNASSVTNEPKRIVACTPRYINTKGLNVANNEVPSKQFGFDALDNPIVVNSGTQKIYLLGYTKDTTIRITQNEPLPMTILSLDMEVQL
jgi:hypothetical protein